MFREYARMGGFMGGMFEDIFAHLGRFQAQKRKEEAGVTIENGLEGIPRLGIPHKFNGFIFGKDDYIYGLVVAIGYTRQGGTAYRRTAYDKTGKLLFECDDCKYLDYGMFLVGNKKEVVILGQSDEYGYALYNEGEKLTEAIFRPHGMSEKFNSCGFLMVNAFGEWSKEYVIDKTGKIVYTKDSKSYHSIYVYDAILFRNDEYINLWTGESICKKYGGYDSKLDTKDHFFIKVDDNCVYQVNKKTCEVIIHGVRTPKPEPPPKTTEDPEVVLKRNEARAEEKRIREKIASAGRNDDCPICAEKGVTIKFKKCNEHFN